MADETKESKVEGVKRHSRHLRGAIAETLAGGGASFEHDDQVSLKFHGIYQQFDREARKAAGAGKADRQYSFMVRVKVPGGVMTADQYLALDRLADERANGTLRITTREGMQLHGVLKGDLKSAIAGINASLLSTLSACGDVGRNVMTCPAPVASDGLRQAQTLAQQIALELCPRTGAYHEIWLDGEKVVNTDDEEPFYGPQYLPRKFKAAIALPGDNCVDIFTQDVGLVAVLHDGVLTGVNVLVGGGLGMTHGKDDTFARLATPLGYVDIEHAVDAVRTVAAVYRDFGNRSDRRHARLKYVVEQWGIEQFRDEFKRRVAFRLAPPVDTGPWEFHDHLGVHEQGDGRWFYGLFVENGRIKDFAVGDRSHSQRRLRTALRELVATLRPGVVLTPSQNILLTDLDRGSIERVQALLDDYGVVRSSRVSLARRYSLACPAMPTCGLAISEAERVMPAVIDEFEHELAELGLEGERLTIRMTGCPNGCARPYTADIAFVGRSATTYDVFVGGGLTGDRLVDLFAENLPQRELLPALRPLLAQWADDRRPGEGFGDYYQRRHGDGTAKTILTGAKAEKVAAGGD